MSRLRRQPPVWFGLLVIVTVLLLLTMSFKGADVMARAGEGTVQLPAWLYPVYALAAGAFAWVSYRQRPVVAWVLEAVMIVTAILLFAL